MDLRSGEMRDSGKGLVSVLIAQFNSPRGPRKRHIRNEHTQYPQ
jgi:hypothetical protein